MQRDIETVVENLKYNNFTAVYKLLYHLTANQAAYVMSKVMLQDLEAGQKYADWFERAFPCIVKQSCTYSSHETPQ